MAHHSARYGATFAVSLSATTSQSSDIRTSIFVEQDVTDRLLINYLDSYLENTQIETCSTTNTRSIQSHQ